MESPLLARLRELFEAGAGEPLGAGRFLPLVTLESGARVGLDAAAVWTLLPDGGGAARRYSADQGHVFYEILESKRDDFDTRLEEAARDAGLPGEDVLFAFPVTGIVRAVLAKGFPHTTRLALHWLRMTELRELRPAIVEVSRSRDMPSAVRDLAQRMIVPE